MPARIKIAEHQGTYFITFTSFNWLPLIQLTKAYDSVYKWFDTLVRNGHFISGYVIMPNHFHGIIYISPDSSEHPTLGKIIGAFKSIVKSPLEVGLKIQTTSSSLL